MLISPICKQRNLLPEMMVIRTQVPDTNDHKCEFCGKTFFSEVLMGYHKKKMHTHSDERPFVW